MHILCTSTTYLDFVDRVGRSVCTYVSIDDAFDRFDVTSYAMDGNTLLVSTATATFAFDTGEEDAHHRI